MSTTVSDDLGATEDTQHLARPNNVQAGYRLALLSLLLAAIVIGLGAFTRLADAGLGCPDWPTCYGHLWVPNTADEISRANAAFAATPVETDKTWPEQIHRIFASSLGLLIIGLVVSSYRQCRRQPARPGPFKLPLLLLVLVILQGLFGMWTVTLKLWPQVVTAHLLGGFATLSLLWLLLQRLGNYQWQPAVLGSDKLRSIKRLALASLVLVVVQIALGGWTTSNYAALACMDIPTCQGSWLPAMNFSEGFNFLQAVGPNYLGGTMDNEARTAIHMSHRLGALAVTLVLFILIKKLIRLGLPEARRMAFVIMAVLSLQLILGLSNVVWQLPLPVAVLHNAGGALLLLTLVTLNHRLFKLKSVRQSLAE